MPLSKKKKTTRRKKNTQKYKKRVKTGGRSTVEYKPKILSIEKRSKTKPIKNSSSATQKKKEDTPNATIFGFVSDGDSIEVSNYLRNEKVDGNSALEKLKLFDDKKSKNTFPSVEKIWEEMKKTSQNENSVLDTKYKNNKKQWEEDHPDVTMIQDDDAITFYTKKNKDEIPFYLLYKAHDSPCSGKGRMFTYEQYGKNWMFLKRISLKNEISAEDYKKIANIPEFQYICENGFYKPKYNNPNIYNVKHKETSDISPDELNDDGIPYNLLYIPTFKRLFTHDQYILNLPGLKYITRIRKEKQKELEKSKTPEKTKTPAPGANTPITSFHDAPRQKSNSLSSIFKNS